jgi:hypothetical protein
MMYNNNHNYEVSIMVRKTEERRDPHQKTGIYNAYTENYIGKLWGDSHLKLYKPWVESMGEISEKQPLSHRMLCQRSIRN